MHDFRHLSWCYYDIESKKEFCERVGIPFSEHNPRWGFCYLLTPSGIAAARTGPEQVARLTADKTAGGRSKQSSDDRYEWARLSELVRATNQVLGEPKINKGVLSRACAAGHMKTTGMPGQASFVSVLSFLAWISRREKLAKEEESQIRNAIIGEVIARNSSRNHCN